MINISSQNKGQCECGCGGETLIFRGKPNRYIHGHNHAKRYDKLPLKQCSCGCGDMAGRNKNSGKPNKYVVGHNDNGAWCFKAGHKPTGHAEHLQTPEIIAKRKISRAGYKATDETKKKQSESLKRAYREGRRTCGVFGYFEKEILDRMELELESKIFRQVFSSGYFVDGFCPELNLVIEIDEPHHRRKADMVSDMIRENQIKSDTGWQFLHVHIDNKGRLVA
ncbi:MAG: DUF559 domain-containing protein [Candidatus Scalindua sp.]|jgi:very-short-patch-repair endonuclease|nr:DUF559 domain-containing protein [Candidatus Scalindua sp.]